MQDYRINGLKYEKDNFEHVLKRKLLDIYKPRYVETVYNIILQQLVIEESLQIGSDFFAIYELDEK